MIPFPCGSDTEEAAFEPDGVSSIKTSMKKKGKIQTELLVFFLCGLLLFFFAAVCKNVAVLK